MDVGLPKVYHDITATGNAKLLIGDQITHNHYNYYTGLPDGIPQPNNDKEVSSTARKLTEEETKCIHTLYQSDYRQHRDRNPKRVPGTCEWFLKHQKYIDWMKTDDSSLLWVSADAGCGKSVLASFLIDEIASKIDITNTTCCYFFFKNDNTDQRDAYAAFSALLHQVISDDLEMIEHAMLPFQLKGERFAKEFHSLWNVLVSMTSSEKRGRNIICVLDGLDECEEKGRRALIETLEAYYSKLLNSKSEIKAKHYLKILITTRPGILVQDQLFELQTIRLRAEDETVAISEDIKVVVETKISAIGRRRKLSDAQQRQLIDYLVGNADRTFLWVSLILQSIEKSPRFSPNSLKELIETTPSDLNGIYEKILNESSDTADARKLLGFIVGAYRPLSLDELNLAFVIKADNRDYEDLDLEPDIESTIKSLCGIFLRITDSIIYLAHQTAREFLLKPDDTELALQSMSLKSQRVWKHSFQPVEQHRALFEVSKWYLHFKAFEKEPFNPDHSIGDAFKNKKIAEYSAKHTLLNYAARFWSKHFSSARFNASDPILNDIMWLYEPDTNAFNSWYPVYWNSQYTSSFGASDNTPLIMAAQLGHTIIVEKILQTVGKLTFRRLFFTKLVDDPINAKDNDERTALSEACANGHEDTVRLLLRQVNIDTNTRCSLKMTPLVWACRKGHLAVVKMLLARREVRVDILDDRQCSALSWAAKGGYAEIAMLLMARRDMDINSHDYYGNTALYYAATGGSLELVNALLIRPDLDVDFNGAGSSPLTAAAKYMHWEIFEALFAYLQSSGKTYNLKSALHNVANAGNIDTLQRLLDLDSDLLNSKGEAYPLEGRSCLSIAAGNGDVIVMNYLLNKPGIDINSEDGTGGSPLMCAVKNEHLDAMKVLLDQPDIGVNHVDKYGNTALHHAIRFQLEPAHMKFVEILLSNPAIIADSKDRNGYTSFLKAAEYGHVELIQMFLSREDINFSACASYNKTALLLAIERGHPSASMLLLSSPAAKKIDIDAQESFGGRTAFHWAAQHGYLDVVERLLAYDDLKFLKDNEGKTPYDLAKEKGHKDIMKVIMKEWFLCYGWDLNSLSPERKVELATWLAGLSPEDVKEVPMDYLSEALGLE